MSKISDKLDEILENEFDEMKVAELLDEEISSGNWIDSDWEDDGEYDNMYEWYIDHNNKEAEDVIKNQIEETLISSSGFSAEEIIKDLGIEIYEYIEDKLDILC